MTLLPTPGTKWRRYRAMVHAAVYRDQLETNSGGLFPFRRAKGLVSWPPPSGLNGLTLAIAGGLVRIIAHPMASEGTMIVFSGHQTLAVALEPSVTGVTWTIESEVVSGRTPSAAIVSPLDWARINSSFAQLRAYDATYAGRRTIGSDANFANDTELQ